MQAIQGVHIPYSGFFSRGNIFTNFANCSLFVKILPVKFLKNSTALQQLETPRV